jgi:hypothetical protein
MDETRRQCKAVNSKGIRDKTVAMPGSDYCFRHAKLEEIRADILRRSEAYAADPAKGIRELADSMRAFVDAATKILARTAEGQS